MLKRPPHRHSVCSWQFSGSHRSLHVGQESDSLHQFCRPNIIFTCRELIRIWKRILFCAPTGSHVNGVYGFRGAMRYQLFQGYFVWVLPLQQYQAYVFTISSPCVACRCADSRCCWLCNIQIYNVCILGPLNMCKISYHLLNCKVQWGAIFYLVNKIINFCSCCWKKNKIIFIWLLVPNRWTLEILFQFQSPVYHA